MLESHRAMSRSRRYQICYSWNVSVCLKYLITKKSLIKINSASTT